MDKAVRGKALIVNVQFKDHTLYREGTDVDRENLKQLFEQLQLEVTVYNDEDGLTAVVGAKWMLGWMDCNAHLQCKSTDIGQVWI